MQREIIRIIVVLLGGGIIATVMMLSVINNKQKDKDQFSNLRQHKGKLLGYHIDSRHSSSKPYINNKLLAINISGLDETMGVYRTDQAYDDILNNISLGDSVFIYYREEPKNNERFLSGIFFNSEIFQLNINNKNIIQTNVLITDHSKGDRVVIFGICFMVFGLIIWTIRSVREIIPH